MKEKEGRKGKSEIFNGTVVQFLTIMSERREDCVVPNANRGTVPFSQL
jgi:hypothetical protein